MVHKRKKEKKLIIDEFPYGVSKDSVIKTQLGLEIVKKLPHGMGIDGDWYIEEKGDKIYAYNSYHTMDDYGFYVGWQDFKVVIPKKEPQKFKVSFRGNQYLARKYMLRDYIEDIISESLGD